MFFLKESLQTINTEETEKLPLFSLVMVLQAINKVLQKLFPELKIFFNHLIFQSI